MLAYGWAREREPLPRLESAKVPRQARVSYDRDIRPILSDRCFTCHGPDSGKRQAKLRLDDPVSALAVREGYSATAIEPGNPAKSEAWMRITAEDPAERMPPADSTKGPLSDEQRELVRRWIEQGAQYEPHWSFVPPARPALPAVSDAAWSRGEIDRFVLAGLEGAGLSPAPEADRATLARRVFLDVTGLPPTPEELDEFLADPAPDAYERLVDRLLTQEPYRTRYAERMAVPWLDQARYADTSGIHMDAGRSIWAWRDWVLRAYRDNMPFDRFVTEQIAGDLVPDATPDQKVASGFHRNHVTSDEGGAIDEEYLLEYAVDRVATTGSVFLGVTMGCARCHDHKFDPFTMEDFYGLLAFFNSIEEPGIYSQVPDAKRPLEPFMDVPSDEDKRRIAELAEALKNATAERDVVSPEEAEQRAAFSAALAADAGLRWVDSQVTAAVSAEGATLTIQPDRSVLASGPNPDADDHVITLRTDGTDLRLIALEAIADPSMPLGRVGRFDINGNAVLSAIEVEAASIAEPARVRPVPLIWAWADVEQPDGDFRVVNALEGDERGWAVDAHRRDGNRAALFLAAEPFGFEGGTELRVTLRYRSIYARHTLGRVRLELGAIGESGLAMLPEAVGSWYTAGPFPSQDRENVFDQAFGPESELELDLKKKFTGEVAWAYNGNIIDGTPAALSSGLVVDYVGHRLRSPTPRKQELSLGSDDGIRVFAGGVEAYKNKVDRAIAPDQDKATLDLPAGASTVVFKIVNTGGPSGFYHRALPRPGVLEGDLVAALLPDSAKRPDLAARVDTAWRLQFSSRFREMNAHVTDLQGQLNRAQAAVPRTMVMRERPMARETFVMTRGQYDHPDKGRPVKRSVPASLGRMPDGAPGDRRGLAAWLVSPGNPLVARVTVNRLWEQFFGRGLLATSEDFGLRGEWPSHPELLDWLAVEFRESGWDMRAMVRRIVTSSTYRQASRVRPESAAADPENRLLSYFPRQRLSAEQIRDQALYVSGLLVEKFGGPSVKPYQPTGLWEEVAMPQSNTRVFERGNGEDLYRRSLYTYWKRAAPPPSMLTFDAPTREFCTVKRMATNTPLQALVLWNDEQFVEAARTLAARTLTEPGDDSARLGRLYARCVARRLTDENRALLDAALGAFRERYNAAPDDAARLLMVGATPPLDGTDPAELAAWTMVANALLSSDAAIVKN